MKKDQLLQKAIKIAVEAHKDQEDKFGSPYITHVFRVMNYGKTLDEKIVGILHDLAEDTHWTFHLLKNEGFGDYIEVLDNLTKREGEAYEDFLKRSESHALSLSVKLNDLRDNMDLRRMNRLLDEKYVALLNKYLKAYQYLTRKD